MRFALLLAAAALASASTVEAQGRTTVDLRAAYAAPTADLGDANLSSGLGFGGTLAYRLQPHLHLYAGWDWMRFTADDLFAGSDVDVEETGYTFGLRFEHPLREGSRRSFRLEAGGLYKHLEVEDAAGDLIEDSGHGLGFEFGAGLLLPLGRDWRLAPALRFRSHSPSFDAGGAEADMRYIGFELGISRLL